MRAFEATPILVENRLFLSTPYNHVIALNPQSGVRLWEYDPHVDLSQSYSEVSSRGVSAWRDPEAKQGQPCRLRIFMGTLDGRLIALDGETGKPCLDFGVKGEVNLALDAATATEWTGGYQVTSAPAIAKGPGDHRLLDCRQLESRYGAGNRSRLRRAEAANYAGRGTPRRGPMIPNREPARATHGRRSPSTPRRIWSSFPPAAPPRTTMAASAQVTTSGPIPSLPYAHPRASLCGDFKWFTMIYGTMT